MALLRKASVGLALLLQAAGAQTLYVSPDGPLKTLAAARDQARRLPPGAPRRIVLAAGTYELPAPIVFSAPDSGLTIEAAAGAAVTLHGGRRVTGWRRDGDRFWAADFPLPDARLLVVNGRVAGQARLPETGAFPLLNQFNVRWLSTAQGGWERKPTAEELTELQFRPEDLPPSLDIRDAEIRVYHRWDESRLRIRSLDRAAGVLTFASPAAYPPGAFGVHKYIVLNIREGMTHPGQWYLDRPARKLVYWPLPGEDMSAAEAFVPALESLLRFEGTPGAPVRNIAVRGLRLALTTTPPGPGGWAAEKFAGAITVVDAENLTFGNLEISNVAGQGLRADRSRGIRVLHSHIHHTGAGGVLLNAGRSEISGNLVHDVGLIYPSAAGLDVNGDAVLVRGNQVHDTPYSAVILSGNAHRVERNVIYRIMKELDDGGAIYITSSRGSVIRANYVHDIAFSQGAGASAYYLDEKSQDCRVENNVSVNVARPLLVHMAVNNRVRRNTFIAGGDLRIELPRSSGLVFAGNFVQAAGSVTFREPPGGLAAMPGNVIESGSGAVLLEYLDGYTTTRRLPLDPRAASAPSPVSTRRPDAGP